MKTCRDCLHVDMGGDPKYGGLWKCKRSLAKIRPVDEMPIPVWCEWERNKQSNWLICRLFSECGKEGRFFKSKAA